MTGKTYLYARVSTEEQTLDVQEAELRAAHPDGILLSEKASGASRDGRHKLALLLEVVGRGDYVVVSKLDRLARDTVDILEIVREIGRKGAGFKALSEAWELPPSKNGAIDPIGEVMLTMLACFAQFERSRMRERQAAGIKHAKANGVYKGSKQRFDPETIRTMKANGMRNVDIAEELECSEDTVERALKPVPRIDGFTHVATLPEQFGQVVGFEKRGGRIVARAESGDVMIVPVETGSVQKESPGEEGSPAEGQ